MPYTPEDYVSFLHGFRAGRSDKILGRRLVIAVTSPNPQYRCGYLRGQEYDANVT